MNPCIWNEGNPKRLTDRLEPANLIKIISLVPILHERVLAIHLYMLWSSVIPKSPSLHKDVCLLMLNIIKVLIFTQKDSLQGMISRCSDLKKTVSIIMQSDRNVKTSDAKKKKKKSMCFQNPPLSESTALLESTAFFWHILWFEVVIFHWNKRMGVNQKIGTRLTLIYTVCISLPFRILNGISDSQLHSYLLDVKQHIWRDAQGPGGKAPRS